MAITDVFFRRYRDVLLANYITEDHRRFFNQASKLIGNRLWDGSTALDEEARDWTQKRLHEVNEKLALEMGVDHIVPPFGSYAAGTFRKTPYIMSREFLVSDTTYQNVKQDILFKERLSLIELALREQQKRVDKMAADYEEKLAEAQAKDDNFKTKPGMAKYVGSAVKGVNENLARYQSSFEKTVDEFNERMRIAHIGFTYSNGLLHQSSDELTQDIVAKPFWKIVAQPMWASVEEQMLEAIDRRDKADRTSAFHAVCALESCMKIVFDAIKPNAEKIPFGHVLIDKLAKDDRFLVKWEADILKSMFSDVRNPFAHGPGKGEMPELTREQTQWAIDTSMGWIKSIVRRL